jgi:tricorn protease
MKKHIHLAWILLVFAALQSALSARVSVTDTRLLGDPAVSASHVAFVYAADLWVSRLDGTGVQRLTTDDGVESDPAFSPDGKSIAFSAEYDGNRDVYVVPVEGGVPTRLTWHPSSEIVQGFTPDGQRVLFTSARAVFTDRFTQLFTVSVQGGMAEPLPIPNAAVATYSPDGNRLAYNPLGPRFEQWKNYRGGTHSRLWLYNSRDHGIVKIPQPEGRSNDTDPMWIGDTVYFRSDRNGEFNLFAYDTKSKAIRQLTRHADFPIVSASAGAGRIVYEQAGRLHLFDPAKSEGRPLTIGVAADLRETRPRFVKGIRYVRGAHLSPSGARAVFEFRGEIVTVPAEKGDPRNLTSTPAVHERSPVWSPDGRTIAYFSDESGEYELHLRPQDGKGETKKLTVTGAGFYSSPMWSPDSQRIAFVDNAQALHWIDVATGAQKKVAANTVISPIGAPRHAWSPDSKWIAYTTNLHSLVTALSVHNVERGTSHQITDGLSAVSEPVFDPSGKYLYLFASTDAGPASDWFSMWNNDVRASRNVYLIVLRKDLPSPLSRESDEEKGKIDEKKDADKPGLKPDDRKPDDQQAEEKTADVKKPAEPKKPAPPVTIDLDGIEYRILDMPIPSGDLSNLRMAETGQLYFMRNVEGKRQLQKFDLAKRKTETLLPDVANFTISADRKKILYRKGEDYFIAALDRKIEPDQGKLAMSAIEVKIDPRAEWTQIFNEAWRINRDYFYAPNMHGANWAEERRRYAEFLPHVATRSDLNRLLRWMSSELAVGHHRVGGGERFETKEPVPGGLLGADYAVENGRYRFKKVYGGLNWNPQLRAPLTEPGVNARAGEYLLAVNGRDVRPPADVYSFFENTAGKIVDITVGPSPDGKGSRTVQVVPVASEAALRNRDWVEGNLRKVHAATKGRVAYVYVPNTTALGHTYFKRYFFPQADKDAIIIDERFNGGGQIADYYIDILRRPLSAYWHTRYGADLKTPAASIQGPKVMIIDETAGSGGDMLPYMFRKFGLGPLVGRPTWGGLVGTLGFPVLMDGGGITAPNLAIWTDEGWVVENVGVSPDIEVEQMPADVIAGRDPQLEKAIAVALAALEKNPPAKPQRPPYPVRARSKTTSTN